MSPADPVRLDVEGTTARITIDREERRNALSPEVVSGIASSLDECERSDEVRAVVLTGAGDRVFCAGADLAGMTGEGRIAQHFERASFGDLFARMRASRLPIVARGNGHALGGGFGLLLACDLVVGVDDAEIGTPEVGLGLWPFIITAVVQRDVPRKVALEMMLTGTRMTMSDARRWGIVNRAVPRAELDTSVDDLVAAVASKSGLAVGLGKRSFYRSEDMGFADRLDYLAGMLTVCLESEDAVEGVAAFLEKRAPRWKHR